MATTIAVTGKGGTGKTTTAALIIRELAKRATGPLLAVDADPDANLGTVLGIEPVSTIGALREETLAAMKSLPAGMSKASYIEAGLHEIITETAQIDLVTMGRPEGPGCYCYINNLLRQFSDELMNSYQWIVMDNEAGMEHISRRTASRIDHLIAVVNESPLSLHCAERIEKLISELKNPVGKMYLLMNRVSPKRVDAILDRTRDLNMEPLGPIPDDPALEELLYQGRSIFELKDSSVVSCVSEIVGRIAK